MTPAPLSSSVVTRVGTVILLSLTASFNPTLVTVTTLMLLLPSPAKLMAGYLLGALMTSITVGLVIVFSLSNSAVKNTTEKDVAETIRQTLLQTAQNDAMTEWAGNLAKNICTGGEISYQIGYTPNPDPCVQYQAATTTTG